MDCGSAAGNLRRIGLRGIEFGHAGVGRIVSLSAGDLWAAWLGAADFFSFHLAAFFQRAAVDCVGRDWAGGIRVLFFSRAGTSVRDAQLGLECSAAGHVCKVRWMVSGATFVAIGMVVLAVVLLVPQDHEHWLDVEVAAGGRNRDHGMDHFCGIQSLSCRAGVWIFRREHFIFRMDSFWGWARPCWWLPTIIGATTTFAFWAMRSKSRPRRFRGRCCYPFCWWPVYTLP